MDHLQCARPRENSVPNLGDLTVPVGDTKQMLLLATHSDKGSPPEAISLKMMSDGGRSSRKSQALEKLLRCRRKG